MKIHLSNYSCLPYPLLGGRGL